MELWRGNLLNDSHGGEKDVKKIWETEFEDVNCIELMVGFSIVMYLINMLPGKSTANTICACNNRASCVFLVSGSLRRSGDITPCSLMDSNSILEYRRDFFYSEDEGNRIPQNVGICLPDCMASKIRRLILSVYSSVYTVYSFSFWKWCM